MMRAIQGPPSHGSNTASDPVCATRPTHSQRRACGENRLPEQAHGQKCAETHINCQTETRPPMRYSRVFDERMMREVKHSVSDCCGSDDPQSRFEADHGQ